MKLPDAASLFSSDLINCTTELIHTQISTMATFGIPEAISAMKIILDIAVKLKNESKELAFVEKEIRKVTNDLSDIEMRMKNPKSPLGQSDARMYNPIPIFIRAQY